MQSKIIRKAEVQELRPLIIELEGRFIGVYRLNGRYFAYLNVCPHQGGPACEGKLLNAVETQVSEDGRTVVEMKSNDRYNIVCPWHARGFHLETGICETDKRLKLMRFEVQEAEETLVISTAPHIAQESVVSNAG
jgi:nitrite reductase/ring-hydroxylating ferredoxin subunit